MNNTINLEHRLEFVIKRDWQNYNSLLGLGDREYCTPNIRLLLDYLLPKLELLNKDFALQGRAVYLTRKKEYEPLEKLGFLNGGTYYNSVTITEKGENMIEAYRKFIGIKSVKEERTKLYALMYESVAPLIRDNERNKNNDT